jgi:hypothetical protein
MTAKAIFEVLVNVAIDQAVSARSPIFCRLETKKPTSAFFSARSAL